MSERISLKDIFLEYLATVPGDRAEAAKIERSARVVRFAEDGVTPLVVEYEHEDEEGTLWITQRNLETGEERFHHVPEDR